MPKHLLLNIVNYYIVINKYIKKYKNFNFYLFISQKNAHEPVHRSMTRAYAAKFLAVSISLVRGFDHVILRLSGNTPDGLHITFSISAKNLLNSGSVTVVFFANIGIYTSAGLSAVVKRLAAA